MGPRPHASLSNPDESPHCPVHIAGFLQLVRIVDPDHPLQAASQASIAFAGGERLHLWRLLARLPPSSPNRFSFLPKGVPDCFGFRG